VLSSDFSFSIDGYFSITYSFLETFATGGMSTLTLYTVILFFKIECFEIFFFRIFSLEIFCFGMLVSITLLTTSFDDYFFFLI
jgi:hypothetical protein